MPEGGICIAVKLCSVALLLVTCIQTNLESSEGWGRPDPKTNL